MPYNTRSGQGPASASTYPITRAFAMVLIAAILFLIAIRYIYGSIHVDAGVR